MNRFPRLLAILVAVALVAADARRDNDKDPAPSADQIQQWIKQLGDESFKLREEATRNLINAGEVALGALTKATRSKDLEVKQRALMIIRHPEKVAKQKERAAHAYFKKLGGNVTVDENSPGKSVVELSIRKKKITAAGLVHLKGLTNLQYLSLSRTNITDAGLVHLTGLTKLHSLNLDFTPITDAGLVHLKGLTNLQKLWLSETGITGPGLVHLSGLTKLKLLRLHNIKVSRTAKSTLQKALPNCKITTGLWRFGT